MKLRSALLLVVAATFCALGGLLTPQMASASVDAVTQWPAMPPIVSNSNAGALSGKFTVGAGTNRVLLVAVATEYTSGNPVIAANGVTYGGTALTNIAAATNTTGLNKIWVGYLVLGNANAPSTATLAVTNTGTAGLTATYVTAAVYNGVDQTTPITGAGSASGSTATLTTSNFAVTGLTGNNGLAVFISNFNGATLNTTGTATKVREYAGASFNLAAGQESVVTNAADSETVTASAAVSGVLAGIGLNPVTRTGTNYNTVTTCGDCHGYPPQDGSARNVPSGQFTGSHDKHAGRNANQYSFLCTQCHYDNSSKLDHSTGYRNITGSSLPGNAYSRTKRFPSDNNNGTGTCTNVTCHSNGRATPKLYATSPAWGGSTTCLSCHGGRSASGLNRYTTSTARFKLSTTHGQHLGKYTVAQINCNNCHGKTAANNTSLANYTGVLYHANGSKTVLFTNLAYGTYTAYKSTAASGSSGNTKTCENISCHGGKTRGAWNENTSVNNDNTCVHCHGTAGTNTTVTNSGDNRKYFAPGWPKNSQGVANAGISTDGNSASTDPRVGGHFKHLSSAYMPKLKCNECHRVPSNPFDAGHFDSPRYSSQTIGFTQASTATKNSTTPAFTNGSKTVAATCTTTYCHGSNMPKGDTTGTNRSPLWNQALTGAPSAATCGACHGTPPRHGQASSAHSTLARNSVTICNGCHGSVSPTGAITNKAKHMNGIVDATGGHEYGFGGSKHMPGGTGSITVTSITDFSKCTGCHSGTSGGSYPVGAANRGVAANIVCTICHKNNPNFYTTGSKGTCGDCHGSNTAGYYSTGQPDGNAFPNISGSHSAHIAQGYGCANCHNNRGTTVKTHGNYSGIAKTTYMNISVAFNATAGPAAKWNNGAGTLANTSCNTSVCHGQKSPAWGAPVPPDNQKCRRCHGSQSVAYTNLSGAEIAPGTGNIDTGRNTGVTARGGAHQEHLKGSSGMSNAVHCGSCHDSAALATKAVNHAQLDNMTTASIKFGGIAGNAGLSPTAARASGIMNCSNVYCHRANRADGTAAGQSGIASRAALAWNNGALIGNTSIADTCTGKCHNMPPGGGVSGDAHAALGASGTYTTPASLSSCSSLATGCHPTIAAAPTLMTNIFADMSKHIDGKVDGGACNSCHGYEVGSWAAKPERSGVPEGKGAHEKHIAYLTSLYGVTLNPSGDQFGAGTSWTNVCGVCHNGASHNTGEAIPGTGRSISIQSTYIFGGVAPHYNGTVGVSSATTPKTCSNLSCHYLTTPIWSTY